MPDIVDTWDGEQNTPVWVHDDGGWEANTAEVVTIEGDQTITGQKTFTMPIIGPMLTTAAGSTEQRLLSDRFADVVNVKDFGAKGDGETDDTAAIQLALNRAGKVFIPAGVYLVSGLFVKSDTVFFGTGIDSTIIRATLGTRYSNGIANEHAFIRLRDGVTDENQVYDRKIFIEDMTIDLNYLSRYEYNSTVTDEMYGCGIGFGGVKDSGVSRVKVINPGLHGFNTQGFSNKVGRKDLTSYDTVDPASAEAGVAVGRCSNIRFDGCIVEGCWEDDGFTTHCSDDIQIVGCRVHFDAAAATHGRMPHSSQAGFEIDGCCRCCSVMQCETDGMGHGFSVVSHVGEVPTINTSFVCCYAKHCCISFGSWKGDNFDGAAPIGDVRNENAGLSIISCVSDTSKKARESASSTDLQLHSCNIFRLSRTANVTIVDFMARGEGDGGTIPFDAARCVNVVGLDLHADINTRTDNGSPYGRIRLLGGSQNVRFSNLCVRAETTYVALFEPSASTGLQVVDGVRFDEEPTNTFYLVNTTLNGGTEAFEGEVKDCNLNSYMIRHWVNGSAVDFTYVSASDCDDVRFAKLTVRGDVTAENANATNATITSATITSASITDASISTITGDASITGDAAVAGAAAVTGNATVTGSLTISGNTITANTYPAGSSSYLGKSTNKWAAIYAKNIGSSGHPIENVYATNGPWTGSDKRIKADVADIGEDVLQAWGGVDFKVFRFKDAVAKKGDAARLHVGVIAQDVDVAFLAEGLDASRYGLFCHDEWGDEWEEKASGERVQTQKAGDIYGIRYEEALVLEAAYQRWRADRAEERLTRLEQRMDEQEREHGNDNS